VSRFSPRLIAVLQAAFVTFLWSTSWVLIKVGLRDAIPPITFAGLRYTLAFLCLIPFALRKPDYRAAVGKLNRKNLAMLVALGLFGYAVTQGAQFVGLKLLPSIAVNLLFSFTAVFVAILSLFITRENPTRVQWAGVAVYLVGVVVYFFPINLPAGALVGILVVLVGMTSNVISTFLARSLNRSAILHPIPMTTITMGIGSFTLLITGLITEGLPTISASGLAIIVWLALVNTAFTFTLWNHTLRTLSALESSVMGNLMLAQIPLLAWIFLGEPISLKAGIGLIFAGAGILLVQLRGFAALAALTTYRRRLRASTGSN